MSYILTWKNPAVDGGKVDITVPVGTTVSTEASLAFTGKGAANYGKVQQENLMRLLENFADTAAPDYPTVGQTWYDASTSTLKVFTDSFPATWKSLGGIQVLEAAEGPPASARLGDLWFERTGEASGYLYAFTGLGRFPYSTTANGGWAQIWPRVDAAGLRQEYDQVSSLINSLMTDPSFVFGRLFTNSANMATLDADLQAKWATTPDIEVNRTGNPLALKTQPVSYDWDSLLSAGRWSVSRLDLPLDSWQDISSFPFVQDGRQVQDYLETDYASTDPRKTSEGRRASSLLGSLTLHRLYTETVNLLSAAQQFKHTLRGIAGASGTNSSFAPDVTTSLHCRRAGNWTGGTATVNTIFRWPSAADRNRFIAGGSAIEVTVRLIGGAGANDTTLNAFLNQRGRIRITADYVRWMDASVPPLMQVAPSSDGILKAINTAGVQSLGSQSNGGLGLSVSAEATLTGFMVYVTTTAPSPITGTLEVTYAVIQDKTVYGNTEERLFPSPLPYVVASDAPGTDGVLVNSLLTAPPLANFTVAGNTGPTQIQVALGSAVNFTFTGAGSPTLIEWDFDGDGVFTATGPGVSHIFNVAGIYSPRVRASNAGGADVLFRPGMIVVA